MQVIQENTGKTIYFSDDPFFFDDGRAPGFGVQIEPQTRFEHDSYIIRVTNIGNKPVNIYTFDDGKLNAIVEQRTFIAQLLVMIILFLLAYGTLVLWYGISAKWSISKLYLAMAVPLTLVYFILFLPWSQPDTYSHYLAAYRCSNILMNYDEHAGRQEDVQFYQEVWDKEKYSNPSLLSYSGVFHRIHLRCQQPELVEMPADERMDYYSIISYLPAAIGIALGRSLNLNTVLCIYLGRFCMLLIYLAVTWRAVYHTPMGKSVFATIALLPMCLMMSSAISYDPMVIVSSLAFYSCVLYLKKRPDSWLGLVEALFWSFVLGAVKGGGYVVLLPVALLLAEKEKRSWVNIASIFCVTVLSLIMFDLIIPKGGLFQLGEEGTGKYSAIFALRNPMTYLNMSAESYIAFTDSLLINTGGTHLAWLEWTMPSIVVMLLYILGGVGALFERDELELSRSGQALLLFTVLLGVIGTPAMLLSWTRIGAVAIDGLQGRYYLPFVPALMLAVTKRTMHHPEEQDRLFSKIWRAFWIVSLIAVFYMVRSYFTR